MLASAGCNPFGTSAKTTLTVTAAPAPPADQMLSLIATTKLHLLRLEAGLAADKSLAAKLTPLRDDRKAHLAALVKEYSRTAPGQKTANTATTGTVKLSPDVALIIPTVRTDAANAQGAFTDAMTSASRYRAVLLASIAACLATHRIALS